jgi:hypothetical protein
MDEAEHHHIARHEHLPTEQTADKETGVLKMSKKGIFLRWSTISAVITALLSTGVFSGSLLHESLYGSTNEMQTIVKGIEAKSLSNTEKIMMLEQRIENERRANEERMARVAEDIHDLKSMMLHLEDHIEQRK